MALGDILRRGASLWEALGVGSEGDVLTITSGEPEWAAPGSGGATVNGYYITDGSDFGPVFPVTPVVNGDFAWINQGGASIDTTNGGVYISAPLNSGVSLRIRKKATPSTPYSITFAATYNLVNVDFQEAGLIFRQSSDGKLVVFWILSSSTSRLLQVSTLNSATSFNANIFSMTLSGMTGPVIWLRITDNGTNRLYSISSDGDHFIQVYSEARTTFLTADEVGFMVNEGSNTYTCGINALSWVQS